MPLPYFLLRSIAAIIRFTQTFKGFYRRTIQGETLEWERAFTRVSRVYAIPSTSSPRQITIRVWNPPTSVVGPRPVHINWHASGFLIPLLGSDSEFCEYLASELGITVLDCDYAKGPEWPFPHAYNDAVDVIKHVLDQPSVYDLNKLTIGGFSAGGSLALTVSATAPGNEYGKIKAAIGFYPAPDIAAPTPKPPKGRAGSTAFILEPWLVESFWQAYVQGSDRRDDPRISPASVDVSALPKQVCIITGENDNLRPDTEKLVEKMKAGGIDVSATTIKDVGHAWDKTGWNGTWEQERKVEAYAKVVEFLEKVYKEPSSGAAE